MFRGRYILPRQQLITWHCERNQQDGNKRYDQLLGGDGNLIAGVRNLMLDFAYLRYQAFALNASTQLSGTLSYNAQREERVNQGGAGNPNAAIRHEYERTSTLGVQLQASRWSPRHRFLTGADAYRDKVAAPAYSVDPLSRNVSLVRGRIPDGAEYRLYGLYLQQGSDLFSGGRLKVSSALRYGGASYRSKSANSPLVNGRPLFPDDSFADNAVTGRIGAAFAISDNLRVHARFSRGFRAPNVTDLGTLGIQGNGFYEAAIADLAGFSGTVRVRADGSAVSTGRAIEPLKAEGSNDWENRNRAAKEPFQG